jgi:hypothetical protein
MPARLMKVSLSAIASTASFMIRKRPVEIAHRHRDIVDLRKRSRRSLARSCGLDGRRESREVEGVARRADRHRHDGGAGRLVEGESRAESVGTVSERDHVSRSGPVAANIGDPFDVPNLGEAGLKLGERRQRRAGALRREPSGTVSP